jgi:hypothetical protein
MLDLGSNSGLGGVLALGFFIHNSFSIRGSDRPNHCCKK